MKDAVKKSGPGKHEKRNLNTLFPQLQGYFSPRIIGEVNDVYVKITRVKGDDVPWHTHDNEDELFYIVKGALVMEIENEASFDLNQGDLYIVRQGVQHRVFSQEECWILLIEQKSTRHTGEVKSDITKSIEEQL
ncbi:MAG: cupin domain-containing protein [Candidatus Zixiibacteriota bacterium]|nr:MAG: cupin domain-containing protein [candidate division Zixibacteria bacterium]